MSPFFSIVIPTYNRAHSVTRAITSVVNQTFGDFEIIIVDDGSRDGTESVVRQLADNRIRYFFKENQERSMARNFGIANAKGRFIGFLDSDDYYYPNHLSEAFSIIERDASLIFLHMAYEVRNEQGELIRRMADFGSNTASSLYRENTLSCNAVIIRSDVLDKFQFIPDRRAVIGEDWYLWLQLAARYPLHFSNRVTSVIVDHGERSLANQDAFRLEQSYMLILQCLANDTEVQKYLDKQYNFFQGECLSLIALYYSQIGLSRTSFGFLWRAFKVHPAILQRKRFWSIIRNVFSKYERIVR